MMREFFFCFTVAVLAACGSDCPPVVHCDPCASTTEHKDSDGCIHRQCSCGQGCITCKAFMSATDLR